MKITQLLNSRFNFLFLCLFVAFSFSSCGDDDVDTGEFELEASSIGTYPGFLFDASGELVLNNGNQTRIATIIETSPSVYSIAIENSITVEGIMFSLMNTDSSTSTVAYRSTNTGRTVTVTRGESESLTITMENSTNELFAGARN